MKYLCRSFRYLTLFLSVGAPISFFITYSIAVGNDHIAWFWPYISDTGAYPPESCIFGFLLNVFGFLLLVVIYLKYRVVSELLKNKDSIKIKPSLNGLATSFGYLSGLGLILVANFEETGQLIVHIIGALMAFAFGIVYFCFQSTFTLKVDPTCKKMFWVRVFITTLNVIFVVGFLAPIAPAMMQFKGKNILKWAVDDGGFKYHITSTFFEWFLMFSYCSFFLTIFWDFRHIRIVPPQIQFKEVKTNDSKTEASRSTKTANNELSI